MSITEAQLILPTLTIEEADPKADAEALSALAKWAVQNVSPLVTPDAPDSLLIDATGIAHLYGGEERLLAELVRIQAAQGLSVRVAIADTTGAAWAWARFGAGGNCPPDMLYSLPTAALRLPPDTVDALAAVGVDTIGELAALPRSAVAKRFDGSVLVRLDQALGRLAEPIRPIAPPRVLAARLHFSEPFVTAEPLMEALRRLLADLCARLAVAGLGACALRLCFKRADGGLQTANAGLARPSRDAAHLERLLAPRLEAIDPGFGIEEARLIAVRVEPLGPKQLNEETAVSDGLAELVDRLHNRPETKTIARLLWRESDIPERSVGMTDPLAYLAAEGWPSELPRPPRLLHPPEPVVVFAMLPDHPPVRFTWRGRSHQIVRADGPERLRGEWWRSANEETSIRDYFQVEDAEGSRFWLFRDGDGEKPSTGTMRWWCHGVFA